MIARLFLVSLGFCAMAATGAQAKDALRVTCTQNGMIVHKEKLALDAGEEERFFVRARYPDALCIFIQDEPTPGTLGIESFDAANSGKISGGTSDNTPSNDLATALAMISSGKPASSMPVDLTDAMQKFRSESGAAAPEPKAEKQKLLNLTIGIYRSVGAGDVISHWKAMQKQGASLRNLTPTLTSIADITMLSVENIADEDADAVCKDAAILGSGCIAFY